MIAAVLAVMTNDGKYADYVPEAFLEPATHTDITLPCLIITTVRFALLL
jgi:hypothetical protein